MPDTSHMQGGFADPAIDAQAGFSAVMRAMAEPGSLQPVSPRAPLPPELPRVMATVALTLLDTDTPVWLDHALTNGARVREWLQFHSGAPIVAAPGDAAFALIADPTEIPDLSHFAHGSDTYPDQSATLIMSCKGFRNGGWALTGPGIRDQRPFSFAPAPKDFVGQWAASHARFPRGVDLILCGPDAVAALPRSTEITVMETV